MLSKDWRNSERGGGREREGEGEVERYWEGKGGLRDIGREIRRGDGDREGRGGEGGKEGGR